MTIADDGNGFDPGIQESTKGLGLRNMRDWMREADGLLLVQTALGRGTTIQAILPLLSTEDLSTQEEPKR
jgi:signal transduction histidine kinase